MVFSSLSRRSLVVFAFCLLLAGGPLAAQPQPNSSPAPTAARALPASQPAEPAQAAPSSDAPKPGGPKITYNSVYVEGPYIAMTFDDGPHGTLTPKLLDMLAARKLKATFYVVGKCVAEYPDILKRIAREGHEVASHSWSHPNLGKMSDEAVRSELRRTDDIIKATIGVRPTNMRPPYGSITPRQKGWIHDEFGYRVIIWDVDPFDWKRPGSAVVTSRIVNQSKPGSIILAHDIHPATVEAMPETFDQLIAKGFKFVTVSELLAMERPAPPKPSVTPIPRRSPGGPAAAGAPPAPGATPPIAASPAPATP
jgi:peptidoglycan/xylan/chitin deacetylase (PgdA/CDA1 family)